MAEGREIRVQGKLSEDKKIVKCDEYAVIVAATTAGSTMCNFLYFQYYYNSKVPTSLAKFHLQTENGVIIDRLNGRQVSY